MNWLVMVLSLVAAATMQTLLPVYGVLGNAKCPLLMCVVLFFAFRRETGNALMAAVLAGFLQDVLTTIPLGYSALVFCVCSWTASRFRNLIRIEVVAVQALFGGAAGSAMAMGLVILLRSRGLLVPPFQRVVLSIVGNAVLGMMGTPLVFRVMDRIDRLTGVNDAADDPPAYTDTPEFILGRYRS